MVAGCLNQAEEPSPTEELTIKELTIASPAFHYHEDIPSQYTCDGENVNPPLEIAGTPKGMANLVLCIDDIDAPKASLFTGLYGISILRT